ncbi:hypothetical protein Q3O59_15460 [Alkalimonas delamerensis]|uniref:Lipocalin-like domain-containing protein n=1 Tax=Alkalimonas delamerensis TaxID=265981 RepID=A0ABT9GU14_9GAMM|nr:hypothetical protein [Alkalimonas delamerensis]MDP4530427.1 hypothetical protein [Alkalimonas delamerensis]
MSNKTCWIGWLLIGLWLPVVASAAHPLAGSWRGVSHAVVPYLEEFFFYAEGSGCYRYALISDATQGRAKCFEESQLIEKDGYFHLTLDDAISFLLVLNSGGELSVVQIVELTSIENVSLKSTRFVKMVKDIDQTEPVWRSELSPDCRLCQ